MDKQIAAKQLRHIQEWLEDREDGAAATHAGANHGGCGCSGESTAAAAAGLGASGSPMVRLFTQVAKAFQPALADDSADHTRQIGSALLLSGTALSRVATDLRSLGADEGGAREKFCERLASSMDDAGHILGAAGGGFLGGTRTSGHEETAPVDRMLRDAASLMLTAPEIKDLGAFTVYGEGLSQLAGPFADLIAALGGRSGGTDSRSDPAESYDQCRTVSGLVVGQVARGFFFGIGAAIPRSANVCPPSCPRQGCTRYCYDEYSSPVGCGTWVRVPQGFFTAGGWSITCTWTIDSIVKDVCCCYPTYWHQFWAYGACTDCTVTIASTGTRAGTYTWVSHTRTAPAAPPNAFKVMLAC